jgi:hypothetical protein
MDECLDALRTAHDGFGRGDAAYSPRCDILVETGMPESRKSTESRRSV